MPKAIIMPSDATDLSGATYLGDLQLGDTVQKPAGHTVLIEVAQNILDEVPDTVTAYSIMVLAQSQMAAAFDTGAYYMSTLTQSTPGDGNLIIYTPDGSGGVETVVVNQASVDAGQVNPAMSALSALMDHLRPGVVFHLGNGCVSGTDRASLFDDSNATRAFSEIVDLRDAIETATGAPIDLLYEPWIGSDLGNVAVWSDRFAPAYFGSNADGSNFTLGSAAPGGATVDHCIYDAQAPLSSRGRGLFARSETAYTMAQFTPFNDAPVDPAAEMVNFSESGARATEPARETIRALEAHALWQTVNFSFYPPPHM